MPDEDTPVVEITKHRIVDKYPMPGEDTPVLDKAMEWIDKINEKYGPETGLKLKIQARQDVYIKDLEENEHDIWVVGPYMKKK